MSKMMWIAGVLAVGLAVLVAAVWIAPWEGNETETVTDKAGAGKTVTVKVDEALADQGKQITESNGCASCHSTDGSKGVGPSWQGIYGTKVALGGGKTVKVSAGYLTKAILDPAAEVREGFSASMPSYQGKLSDEDVKAIIEYLKSLK